MEIELRQHQDGSFILEVQNGTTKNEIDVTHVIHEIFLDKLKELQARVRMEEKYRNWVVESAQTSKSALSTAFARYSAIVDRLNQINDLVQAVFDTWKAKRDLKDSVTRLAGAMEQNKHFLKHDKTLQLLEELNQPKK